MMKNKFLYKNFLENNRIYSLAKNWWKREFKKQILGKKSDFDTNSDWVFNWHNDYFKDGNPIFTIFSKSKQKLVRIIQEENENNQDSIEISAWIQKGFYPKDEIPELVISLELSRNSSKIAFNWIKKWFDNQLEDKDLERDFDERNSVSV
jgi:predicted N-acyltransferase